MNLIKKVLLCIIIFTEATLLYGEESTEKQIPQNPVFKLNLDYIYIPDVMSDRTEEIESKKDREWESKEYNASAAANFTFFDSLKITNKAQYGRAEYSAEGFPKELIVMGNEITLSYGDLLIMGGAKI
mgnify:CR=1 FL=1